MLAPQNLHFLQRDSLGLRQEEDGVQSHHQGPESKEDVCAPLQVAQHGEVDLADQEGGKEVDTDGDTLGWRSGFNGVHL